MRSHSLRIVLALSVALVAFSSRTIAQEGNPQGRWSGRWQSESTGHSGPMNVSIRPTSNGNYQARFTGRFALVIPFAYRAELVPQTTSQGQTVLTTQIVGNSLSGGFQAAGDRGTITMRRVR